MTIHIVGGGIAGLTAAVACAGRGRRVVLYEASRTLGGRCRSHDAPGFDGPVDNGAHAILSNNTSIRWYLDTIGSWDTLQSFPAVFADVPSGQRWSLKLPEALWNASARPPGTCAADLLAGIKLLVAPGSAAVGDVLDPSAHAAAMLWEPLCTSALNTPMKVAAAAMLKPVVLAMARTSGLRAGLLLPTSSLAATYIAPAERWLSLHGTEIRLLSTLRDVSITGRHISGLHFDGTVDVAPGDAVILALPFWSAVLHRFGITDTWESSAIVNAHYRVGGAQANFFGLTRSTAQWVWLRGGTLSVTVSAADGLVDLDSEVIAERLWTEAAPAAGLSAIPMPRAHVIKERRATLRHLPHREPLRPKAQTAAANLFLAGDWTATGLPSTLESAAKSGLTASTLAFAVA